MKTFKHLLIAAAGSMLFAGQAFAVPVQTGSETSLQQILDDIAVDGDNFIDVNDDQFSPSSFWKVQGSGGSFSQIIIEITANSSSNTLGIFDAADENNRVELYSGADTTGSKQLIGFSASNEVILGLDGNTGTFFADSLFGFYLDTPNGIFYSAPGLNEGGQQRSVVYQGNDEEVIQIADSSSGVWGSNEYIFGWEDGTDQDFQDFVFIAESITSVNVPEPSELALALFGLGLIGVGVVARRSRRTDPTLAI
ncbi:hypothetical protein SADO_16058 [Salinisphaera dokdonensis CL-ES53]|uniref:Ice-binding protein C-terminal domain-containing protein n=2 Tax=Salinisphaera TaxID=180541 RepID=A0ABV2B5Q7_9GAMM